MIDYAKVMQRFGVPPIGVLHLGAFDGAEDPNYQALGFRNRLFVEAQPDTYARLCARFEGTGTHHEHFAISDTNGVAQFHVANNGQSSSLLTLEKHLRVYPDIQETGTFEVKTIRVDDLLNLPVYADLDFNFMNVDIQGAELLALSGACNSLKKFDMLNLEVNFDVLYTGVPHVTQIDAFLSAFDFVRADTVLAHSTWGDAIYIRNKFTKV